MRLVHFILVSLVLVSFSCKGDTKAAGASDDLDSSTRGAVDDQKGDADGAPARVADTKPTPDTKPAPAPDAAPEARSSAPPETGSTPSQDTAACVPQDCELYPVLESHTAYPVVLVHGMFGFDEFILLGDYYGGVETRLRKAGYAVYTAVMDPVNGSDMRAAQLASTLDTLFACTCAEKVNLIGHSQGGIDARYLVAAMDYAHRVASITTIATPHHGTEVADAALGLIPDPAGDVLDFFAWMLTGIYTDPLEDPKVLEALKWCSTAHIAAFTKAHPHPKGVASYSYAGRAGVSANGKPECEGAPLKNPTLKMPITAALLPTWTFLGGLKGKDNDGLVSVESAKWGEFRGCLPADHVQEIGMFIGVPSLFDHMEFYLDHAKFLAERGH